MTFRLPRLPETAEIVEINRRPSFKFQRWWQSIVSKLEAQENRQDALAADILSALAQAGIAVDTANAALDAAGAIMPDLAPITILADYTGAVLDGQLPRNVGAQRFKDETNVTTDAAWSATTLSGGADYTIGATTGVLNITAITTTTVVQVTSDYDGITRSRKLTIYKTLQDPPPSSGGTTEYDSTITATTSASYGAANAGPLTITCGASGNVDLSAPLEFTTTAAGAHHAWGKWQYSVAGAGVWNDVGAEIQSDLPASGLAGSVDEAGAITIGGAQGGLTPASDYDFQLLLRNDSGSDTLSYSGTASAATS